VTLLVLRRNIPRARRPSRLWAAALLAPVAFICGNLVIYWTGFVTNTYLFVIVFVGFILYALYFHLIAVRPSAQFGWRNIVWLFPWFAGMWALSGVSTIGHGAGLLGLWPGVVLVVIALYTAMLYITATPGDADGNLLHERPVTQIRRYHR
jgi:hypothetical protein